MSEVPQVPQVSQNPHVPQEDPHAYPFWCLEEQRLVPRLPPSFSAAVSLFNESFQRAHAEWNTQHFQAEKDMQLCGDALFANATLDEAAACNRVRAILQHPAAFLRECPVWVNLEGHIIQEQSKPPASSDGATAHLPDTFFKSSSFTEWWVLQRLLQRFDVNRHLFRAMPEVFALLPRFARQWGMFNMLECTRLARARCGLVSLRLAKQFMRRGHDEPVVQTRVIDAQQVELRLVRPSYTAPVVQLEQDVYTRLQRAFACTLRQWQSSVCRVRPQSAPSITRKRKQWMHHTDLLIWCLVRSYVQTGWERVCPEYVLPARYHRVLGAFFRPSEIVFGSVTQAYWEGIELSAPIKQEEKRSGVRTVPVLVETRREIAPRIFPLLVEEECLFGVRTCFPDGANACQDESYYFHTPCVLEIMAWTARRVIDILQNGCNCKKLLVFWCEEVADAAAYRVRMEETARTEGWFAACHVFSGTRGKWSLLWWSREHDANITSFDHPQIFDSQVSDSRRLFQAMSECGRGEDPLQHWVYRAKRASEGEGGGGISAHAAVGEIASNSSSSREDAATDAAGQHIPRSHEVDTDANAKVPKRATTRARRATTNQPRQKRQRVKLEPEPAPEAETTAALSAVSAGRRTSSNAGDGIPGSGGNAAHVAPGLDVSPPSALSPVHSGGYTTGLSSTHSSQPLSTAHVHPAQQQQQQQSHPRSPATHPLPTRSSTNSTSAHMSPPHPPTIHLPPVNHINNSSSHTLPSLPSHTLQAQPPMVHPHSSAPRTTTSKPTARVLSSSSSTALSSPPPAADHAVAPYVPLNASTSAVSAPDVPHAWTPADMLQQLQHQIEQLKQMQDRLLQSPPATSSASTPTSTSSSPSSPLLPLAAAPDPPPAPRKRAKKSSPAVPASERPPRQPRTGTPRYLIPVPGTYEFSKDIMVCSHAPDSRDDHAIFTDGNNAPLIRYWPRGIEEDRAEVLGRALLEAKDWEVVEVHIGKDAYPTRRLTKVQTRDGLRFAHAHQQTESPFDDTILALVQAVTAVTGEAGWNEKLNLAWSSHLRARSADPSSPDYVRERAEKIKTSDGSMFCVNIGHPRELVIKIHKKRRTRQTRKKKEAKGNGAGADGPVDPSVVTAEGSSGGGHEDASEETKKGRRKGEARPTMMKLSLASGSILEFLPGSEKLLVSRIDWPKSDPLCPKPFPDLVQVRLASVQLAGQKRKRKERA